ncbi:hypothetical protein L3X38_032308 [Prunus dulcis]|uniref:Uncharacterized protein n=1 Tax=Prunus dulcis TaxID=3755 RepID=A0AAD4VG00_PRUDU|nr:hypothetical protein L3X38_032308 [Prunus dulcis]
MSDVIPPNEVVSYPGDQPWHVPFPSPPGTPNNDPTSSGSEADNNDPLKKIAEVKHHLQYLCTATDWWETKCDIHGQDYASVVSPDYNWSEIDVGGVWQVLNRGGQGMVDHSLVHAARKKTKELDLFMDL